MVFVQTFDGGSWIPKSGADGIYGLTLTGANGQTVYFSDRPDRLVGLTPTQQFLDGLGFTPANPPNAAIVVQGAEATDREILVVELLNPVYHAESQSLTYDARMLGDYEGRGLATLASQQNDYEISESFGAGSLFIDDCANLTYGCTNDRGATFVGYVSVQRWWDPESNSCRQGIALPVDDCKDTFSACSFAGRPSCEAVLMPSTS